MSEENIQETALSWERGDSSDAAQGEGKESGFVNHGFLRWEEARAQWHASKKNDSTRKVAVPLDVDEIIDIIFSPRWRMPGQQHGPPRRFPQNVPLTQMVDVLVDLWEAEGLDM